MEYFMTARRRKGQGYGDEVGPIRYLEVDESTPAITRADETSRAKWFSAVQKAAGGSHQKRGNVLFFVHGFNTEQDEMRARHKKIVAGLRARGTECVVVGFDWPSDGDLFSYFDDRTDARRVALEFLDKGIEPFARLQRPDCVLDVHILAHSMGCFLVREAFDYADDRHVVAQRSWTVAQVALVAADISQKSMRSGSSKTSSLLRHAARITNYYSHYDEVLSISSTKRVGLSRRLGRVGLPDDHSDKALNLYCGALYHEIEDSLDGVGKSHWWYFESPRFYEDLAYVLEGGLDRDAIPTRGYTDRGNRALIP